MPREQPGASAPVPPRVEVVELGSFAHGTCRVCGWKGPGRRARRLARVDARTHEDNCSS